MRGKGTIWRVCAVMMGLMLVLMPACTEKWGLDEADDSLELNMGLGMPLAKITANVDSFLPQSNKDWVIESGTDGTVYLKINNTSIGDYNQNMEQHKTYYGDTVKLPIPPGISGTTEVNVNLGKINDDNNILVDWGQIDSLQFMMDIIGLPDGALSDVKLTSKLLSAGGKVDTTIELTNQGKGRYRSELMFHKKLWMNRTWDIPLKLSLTLKTPLTTLTNVEIHPAVHVGTYDVLYGIVRPDVTKNHSKKNIDLGEFFRDNGLDSLVLPFKNPQVRMTIESNVGGPIKFYIDSVKCVTAKGKAILAKFSNTYGETSFHTKGNNCFDYTTDKFPHIPGDTALNELTLDKSNARTDLLFNYELGDYPETFGYEYTLALADEYVQYPDRHQMYVTGYPFYNLRMDALLPFDFNNNLAAVMTDTADLTIDKNLTLGDETLYLTGQNGLPVRVDIQLTYTDSSYHVLGKSHTVLDAPKVDSDGKVLTPLGNFTPINLQVKLGNIRHIIYRLKLLAPVGCSAHFEKTNRLNLNVAVKGRVRYVF